MAEAVQKLPEYLSVRPVPFYSWLRRLPGRDSCVCTSTIYIGSGDPS